MQTEPQLNIYPTLGTPRCRAQVREAGNRAAGKSKYGNRKTDTHASKKEHYRAAQLRLLEKAGKIRYLREQVRFELIPAQYELLQQPPCGAQGATPAKTKDKAKPRLIERACTYVADFVYTDAETGRMVVEDAKGMRTEVYKIKRKLMLYVHGIQIKET